MLPCPLQCTERDALGSAKDEPCTPGTLPRDPLGTLCPIPTWKHHPGWHRAVPGTARAQRGGQQRLSKTRHGRRAAKGGLFTLHSSSKQLSGCREGFPGSWREGWPPCSIPPRFTSHVLSEGSPGTLWGPRRWQSPQCTRPAPCETAQLISSPLSLPVPSGLAGGSGSNRSEETAGKPRGSIPPESEELPGLPQAPHAPQLQLDPNSQRIPQLPAKPPAGRDVAGPRSAVQGRGMLRPLIPGGLWMNKAKM